MDLSGHFTLKELTLSDYAVRKGLNNEPGETEFKNLEALCENVLEPLRDLLDTPISVTSGYRSKEVNKGIGGAKNSQHVEGKAADIRVKGYTIEGLFGICKGNLQYDQLIQEFDEWVHISWNGEKNRQQALRAVKQNGKTVYTPA